MLRQLWLELKSRALGILAETEGGIDMTDQKKPIQAVVFDAYGTLFDVHSVMEACEEFYPGEGKAISQTWRQKQLEYSWLLSLMERYEPFESITRLGLIFALRSRNLPFDEAVLGRLMGEYRRLRVFPEAFAALERMKGRKLAILSNGNPEMLEPLLEYTGIDRKIPLLLSVEEKKVFKPHPTVYEMAPDSLGIPKEEILFVSANSWDVAGARSYGLRVAWINRARNQQEELDLLPEIEIQDLEELADYIVGK